MAEAHEETSSFGETFGGVMNLAIFVGFWIAAAAIPILAGEPMVLVVTALLAAVYYVAVFHHADAREQIAHDRLKSHLMEGEELVSDALQKRLFALTSRRMLIGITSSRIIMIKRGLLGGFIMQDIQWKDLVDATTSENILASLCGSNLAFEHSSMQVDPIAIPGVDRERAAVIYARSQKEEQAWEEKRRIRAIEETRAASGGVFVQTSNLGGQEGATVAAPATGTPHSCNRILADILKAKELMDAGVISDAEFQEMKAKILAG